MSIKFFHSESGINNYSSNSWYSSPSLASWYIWYSEMRSAMLLAASLNSSSSMPAVRRCQCSDSAPLSLVEVRRVYVAVLCHKDTAQGTQRFLNKHPIRGIFCFSLCLYGIRLYGFQESIICYRRPYAIKTQLKVRISPYCWLVSAT